MLVLIQSRRISKQRMSMNWFSLEVPSCRGLWFPACRWTCRPQLSKVPLV